METMEFLPGNDDRKIIQDLLKQNKQLQQKYATIEASISSMKNYLDLAPVGIFVLDSNGFITEADSMCAQLFGYKHEVFISKPLTDFVEKNYREIFLHYLKLIGTSIEKLCFEIKMKKHDQSKFLALVKCDPVSNNGESVILLHVEITDISNTTKRDGELRALLARLQLLEHEFRIGIFQASDNGKLIFVNHGLAELLGYDSTEELLKIPAEKFYQNIEIQNDLIQLLKEKGTVHSFEQKVRKKDGSFALVSIHIQMITVGAHWYVLGGVEDISCIKQTDEMLRVQHSLARVLSTSKDFAGAIAKILDIFFTIEGIDCGGVYTFDRNDGELKLALYKGLSDNFGGQVASYPKDAPETKLVLLGNILYQGCEDIIPGLKDVTSNEGILSFVAIPVFYEGEVIASINLASRTHKEFPFLARYIIDNASAQIGDIIGRLCTENALRESEENFRALAANAKDGILIGTDKGPHFYINKSFCEITGYTNKELLNEIGLKQLVPPEEFTRIRSKFQARMQGKNVPFQYETIIIRKDGKKVPVEVTTSKTTWQGMPVGLVLIRDVSSRKRMEKELRESEENFRALAANANDGILIGTRQGVHEYANKRASEITGYDQQELLKMSFHELAHPDELSKIAARSLSRITGEKVTFQYETLIVNKNGESVPIELTCAKTIWQGEPADIVIIRDVSRRKKIEDALKKSEKRYRAIVEDQTELIFRIQPDGVFTFVNDALRKYYEIGAENFIGNNFSNWISEREQKIFYKKFSSLTEKKPVLFITRKIKSPEGAIRWQQWLVRAIFNEENVCTEYQFVGRDITKLKQVQKELNQHRVHLEKLVKKRTERLVQANEQLHQEIVQRKKIEEELRIKDNAINTSINAFALADLKGTITYVNPACLQLLQYKDENELMGLSDNIFWFSTERKRSEIKQSLQKVGTWVGEMSVKRKDNSSIDVYLSANIVKDKEGNPTSIMASFIDISQLKLLRDQLIRSERLAATGQLAISVAHEINSPLQAITILLSMLKKKYTADADLLEKLTLLKNAHTSIRDTVQKLLYLNRPRTVEKQWIDVNRIMENTVSLLRSYLRANKINLKIELSENLPKIEASPQQINQVFLNLVNNAIEALSLPKMKTGDNGDKEIVIKTKRTKNDIIISVADNGPGISEQDTGFIFDSFYTSKKQMGVGVGLSVCHAIVESHQGMIEVNNLKTGGAIFTVTLPVEQS